MKMRFEIIDPRPLYTFSEARLPGNFQKTEGVSRILKNIRTYGRVQWGIVGYGLVQLAWVLKGRGLLRGPPISHFSFS